MGHLFVQILVSVSENWTDHLIYIFPLTYNVVTNTSIDEGVGNRHTHVLLMETNLVGYVQVYKSPSFLSINSTSIFFMYFHS